MLLTFARIITTGSWVTILGFFLAYHYSVKKYLPDIKLPISQSKFMNVLLFIFYILLYSTLWTNEASFESRVPAQWVLSSVFLGFLLVITGTILIILATKTLHDKWLISTTVLDFSIFQVNPFTIIRYPFQSAQVLIWLGSALMFINPFGFVLGIPLLIPILKRQAQKDDLILIATYGDSYLKYKKGTGGFFPKIW